MIMTMIIVIVIAVILLFFGFAHFREFVNIEERIL